ncbi:MSHA biogenesis protein MshE [Gammaproteobacteria bacterium]
MAKTIRLGEWLIQNKAITQQQLDAALSEQKKTGEKLGKVLVTTGILTENALLNFLSKQLNIPVFDLTNFISNQKVTRLLPEAHARRLQAIILEKRQNDILVGMVDPLDITAIDDLKRILNYPIQIALVSETLLARTIDLSYRRTEEITNLAGRLYEELGGERISFVDLAAETKQLDAPVVRLLQSLFEDAVQMKASDIHIEPDEKILRIRLRIDGVLHEQIVQEGNIASAIAMRLKLISGLNITEKRLPQDGRFHIRVRDHIVDVRLSLLPTQYGESMVMRLLDQSQGILNLDQVIPSPDILKNFRELLHSPNGLLLTTGPTGSGKTTTLYSALNELNEASKNIITVEDPVEYRLPRVNQVQINSALDFTFARALRSILRQDPNIILVGEMRDVETANIAMRAALTGHLVLSTLHTNDAASSALRLIDMGIEGFLVAATLRGVLAQRLIRKICENCKTSYQLTTYETKWFEQITETSINNAEFAYGKGCSFCNRTGYKGRLAVFELLTLTPETREALRIKDPTLFSQLVAKHLKGHLLVDEALMRVKEGISTLSEAMRLASG